MSLVNTHCGLFVTPGKAIFTMVDALEPATEPVKIQVALVQGI
jgi:hypothetical protein